MPMNAISSRVLLVFILTICLGVYAAPRQQRGDPLDKDQAPNRLAYTITRAESPTQLDQSDVDQAACTNTKAKHESYNPSFSGSNNFLRVIEKSGLVQRLLSAISKPQTPERVAQDDTKAPAGMRPRARASTNKQHVAPQLDQPLRSNQETSFSLDSLAGDGEGASVWKKTLFGPSGLLTEIFNMVNDKRKEGLETEQTGRHQLADPSEPASDFSKILDSLIQKTQSGNFDEPLPEIPFIGICNRLSCGDIYKAVDEFRKSELFSNFQTALSLIHDPKGWDIIGDLLANPELIENFTGKGNIQDLLGGGKGSKGISSSIDSKSVGEIKSGDGELGVDFSPLVDGQPEEVDKSSTDQLPEIAESIDSPDYYSSVDKTGEEALPVQKKVTAKSFIRTTSKPLMPTPIVPPFRTLELLPEIAESVDGVPEEFESMTIEKQEIVKPSATSNSTTNASRGYASRQAGSQVVRPVEYKSNAVQKRFFQEVEVKPTPSTSTSQKSTQKPTTPKPTTSMPTTTKRNFRKENDYYSMYYDG